MGRPREGRCDVSDAFALWCKHGNGPIGCPQCRGGAGDEDFLAAIKERCALLSAAPDLLAACEAVVGLFARWYPTPAESQDMSEDEREVYWAARGAIAKARGGA